MGTKQSIIYCDQRKCQIVYVFLLSYTAQRYKTGSFLPNRAHQLDSLFTTSQISLNHKSVTTNHVDACPNDAEMRLASKSGFTDVRNWKRGVRKYLSRIVGFLLPDVLSRETLRMKSRWDWRSLNCLSCERVSTRIQRIPNNVRSF